jgi:predicted DNA-binding transcriptional regulator AlpA
MFASWRESSRAFGGVKMSERQKLYYTATQVRRRYGGISEMGLWRWINDGKINFPKPDMIPNGRRLWSEETLDRFDARLSVKEAA